MRLFRRKQVTLAHNHVFKLTALQRAEFDVVYTPMLDQLDLETTKLLVDTLRVRRAFILPKYADSEDVALLSNVMTYALSVAIAVEAESKKQQWHKAKPGSIVLPVHALLYINQVVPEAGQHWLSEKLIALNEVIFYLLGNNNSMLREVVDQARKSRSIANQQAGIVSENVVNISNSIPHDTPENNPKIENENDKTKVAKKVPETQLQLPLSDGSFLDWLRSGIEGKSLSVNELDSVIHGIDSEGTFVVLPDGLEEYAAINKTKPGTVKNKLIKLGVHRQTDRKNIYTGTLGDQKVEGLVLEIGVDLPVSENLKI